jgi:cyclophilin family peptidyl-prolyl cis-trans isomerase
MRRVAVFIVGCALAGCRRPIAEHPAGRSAPVSSAASTQSSSTDARRLLTAEQRRDSSAIDNDALSSRDPQVRRRAARALARIADSHAADLLTYELADEDDEVVSWSAYGLGYACRGREASIVHALVVRGASLSSNASRGSGSLWPAAEAIADALGRCGGAEAEATLRAWLSGPQARAEAAALDLGRLVPKAGRLADATLVALLDAASRASEPLENALYPFSRLGAPTASVTERLLPLARELIASGKPSARFAVGALGRATNGGAAILGELIADPHANVELRADATRELRGLGAEGQHALWAAFEKLPASAVADSELESANYGGLSSLLDALEPADAKQRAALTAFAALPLPGHDSPALTRRKIYVRCAASQLRAGNVPTPELLACDPTKPSRPGALALLKVLDRGKLAGARLRLYTQQLQSDDVVVREAALELLSSHGETGTAYAALASALTSKSPGLVATAAQILASYPERAAKLAETDGAAAAPHPDPSLLTALATAYDRAAKTSEIEVRGLLIDAASALQVLSLKERIIAECSSDHPSLREHAEKALHLLGDRNRQCDHFSASGSSPEAADTALEGSYTLSFATDVGPLELHLNADLAPVTVSRIVGLARNGFYDGLTLHRVVPGFVDQFGDPAGDGYGNADGPALRCETSPIAFEPGDIGLALAGRDTGSSQLFVTLGRYPHLDGDFAWLGHAGPGWDRATGGDRIQRVRVTVP